MTAPTSLSSIDIQPTPEDRKDEDWFDNTKINAVNTCPIWGIVRYGMRLQNAHGRDTGSAGGRAMALEAGSAAHEFFAAVRLLQLYVHDRPKHREELFNFHGARLFNTEDDPERFEQMCLTAEAAGLESAEGGMAFCLQALYSSGFYDDPDDNRRTMSNIEESCMAYYDRWNWSKYPIYVADEHDPHSMVGIEIPFDVVITVKTAKDEEKSWRFVGKADGLCVNPKNGEILLDENKTASVLNDAWEQSFASKHQPSAYIACVSAYLGIQIAGARVIGLQIPMPRSYGSGMLTINTRRSSDQLVHWVQSVYYTITHLYEPFLHDVQNAPQFTEACNRYFRPCALIPLCTTPRDEWKDIFDEMVEETWNPLT